MSNNTTTVGPSVGTLLTLLFVALKLTGVIAWSWWWVLAPTWIPLVIAIALVTLVTIVG